MMTKRKTDEPIELPALVTVWRDGIELHGSHTVPLEGIAGVWAQVRWPGGAGAYHFSLKHGWGSTSGGAKEWRLCPSDLEVLRAAGKKMGARIGRVASERRIAPRRTKKPAATKQTEMFE